MRKVLIIGGGLSGLSSATFLSNSGYQVELIEASPKLGGKTYSFNYNGSKVDNGQHILMECYSNTLEYVDLIGSRKLFDFQESLSLTSVDADGKAYKLKVPKHFYPLNHLIGFLKYKLFTLKERVEIIRLLLKIKYMDEKEAKSKTLYEFLVEQKQSERTISLFWDNVVISAMNTKLKSASAEMFIRIVRIIFFENKRSANIIIPNVDLSSAFVNPAQNLINRNGGKISTSEKAIGFIVEQEKIISVETNKRTISDYDFIISALPEYGIRKIAFKNGVSRLKLPALEYSPIVSVHVWLNENPLKEKMYNLIEGEFDWLFNHGEYITLIKSSAEKLVTINNNEVIKIVFSELKKYFAIFTNIEIKEYVVLKEKRATFISDSDSIEQRNSLFNPYSNMFLVGDWTKTELPATIEGAIKSGKDVAEKIKML
ncbi:MAG: hydroxysqualene dehydroxylase HpnE [Melioribacteraceae bacterium]|nr:hydroxysqualene dehydroxylase HpnE [Melioribacteraceae bacterium]